ncbi:Cytidine and deoxycytidylate deaminase zinc-binding region [Caballeronia choica]|jgi:tRNA(Arg) A34 adenosine deaminase TadA|uniref:Cytidine and deoxycytidylate deaminase zinc-binding region n=1 Tax=Caballeronia choica TaxID=326476 RepID=A0A158F052_9BURK|nr:Bd3614 family nucleic acid deaminase [Caballeronia choica]SAL13226.1 Cytidine and deoxycytidylate deaminase zinc-binding region [Caballeronia choica]
MPKVSAFFATKTKKKVAARISNKDSSLYYYEVDTLGPVPPSVFLHASMAASKTQPKGKIMVNYPTDSWVNQNNQLEFAYDSPDYINTEYRGEPKRCMPPDMKHWDQFGLTKLGTPPNLPSIYDEEVPAAHSKARRIYMLATFCLLKKLGFVYTDRTLGHNIGTMLVSKTGKVLSWGVNTGEYRHAEVNTLIGYFLRNPTETNLPVESVLFSTLKPCRMCSTFINQAWNGGKTRVFYGMMDEGESGGTPLLGTQSTKFTGGELELDVWELLSESGTLDSAIKAKGTKPVQVTHKGGKVDLYDKLSKSGGSTRKMSAADWVDKSPEVVELLNAAVNKFQGKAGKARDDGPIKSVLSYLKEFVKG